MTYKDLTFQKERSLYNIKDSKVINCKFQGEEDGESPLKECKNALKCLENVNVKPLVTASNPIAEKKLKDISAILDDEVLIVDELMEMVEFMRTRFHLRYADILRLYVPSALRSGKVAPKYQILKKDASIKIMQPNNTKILVFLVICLFPFF